MELAQTGTTQNPQQTEDSEAESQELLKIQHEQWITFCAIGGIVTHDAPEIDPSTGMPKAFKRITVGEFAEAIHVPRRTLYNWKTQIPNFGERVRERRSEVWSLARETAVFNRLFLIGMSGTGQPAVTALLALAGHFSKLQLPVQRQDIKHEGESWSSLIERKRAEQITEGEVIEHAPSSNNS